MIKVGKCFWLNVVGRNRVELGRARACLGLPSRLLALTLCEYLQPMVIRVPPTCFVATYFTSPSARRVFRRHPVFLWVKTDLIVTISPWARSRGVLGVTSARTTERDEVVAAMLEAVLASHEDVGWHLNDAFCGNERSEDHVAWHGKERQLTRFCELLDRQHLSCRRWAGAVDSWNSASTS